MGANTLKAHLKHLHGHGQSAYLAQALAYLQELGHAIPDYKENAMECGCPGSAPRDLTQPGAAPASRDGLASQLSQWPVQLHLLSPQNPVFEGADLLLAADCCAFAMADFNPRWLPGKKLAIACPKLDQGQEVYLDKLTALVDEARINTLTVMIMEVPCCHSMLQIVKQAWDAARPSFPVRHVIISTRGAVVAETTW